MRLTTWSTSPAAMRATPSMRWNWRSRPPRPDADGVHPHDAGGGAGVDPAPRGPVRQGRRRALRHDLGLHQVGARLRPRRGALLAGQDALRRRVRRASSCAGCSSWPGRTSAWPTRSGWSLPTPRPRPSSGSGCRRASIRSSRPRCTWRRRPSPTRPRPTSRPCAFSRTRAPSTSRAICRMPTAMPPHWATAPATATRTSSPSITPGSSTCPTRCSARISTVRPTRAMRPWCRNASSAGGRRSARPWASRRHATPPN